MSTPQSSPVPPDVGLPAAEGLSVRATGAPSVDSTAWVWRIRHLVVSAMLFAFALNSDPGKLVADTKLDLVVNPVGLLERALHLWDPLGAAGQLQDQAYGYLFPMGPFFAVAHAVNIPGWVTQRLWWGLLLTVSYTGFVALARRLRIGSEWTRLVAGLGFALAPHVLTVIGRASVEAWPPALAPWVLVPLVGVGSQGRPRRATALSGLAVLAMGGVNAAVDFAAILPAALWLLTRRWSWEWFRLVLWWGLAMVAATLWWLVPLVALGRYSPPFLDFIESASITTSTTTLIETLRGTADWVAYLGDSGSRAGYALLTHPLLILYTVLLTALGLAGVAWRRTTERIWLVLMLTVGVTLVTLGHIGPVDGFFAADLRGLLDGVLAPLRNVHKFDILIRLALSLGTASALAALSRGRTGAETRFLKAVVAAAGAFVVVGASTPFFSLHLANPDSFTGVPDYWVQASAWLTDHGGTGRTLLVPGSRFPQYDWGNSGDEPIQALGQAPWDIRNAIPLTEAGHIRWLDSIERQIADGFGGPDLADELAAGGVRYVLARNDLSYGVAVATRPVTVRAAMSATPGVYEVASFGPPTGGGSTPERFNDQGLNVGVPALDIYEVTGAHDLRARLVPTSSTAQVVGGAEAADLPGVADAPDAVMTNGMTASTPAAGGARILTDTPRRREVNFGIGTFGASQTLTLADPLRIAKPTRDYGSSDTPGAQASARYDGAVSISASSSASDADSYPRSDPGAMPYSAFDTSMATEWRPNPIKATAGSWLSADFGRTVSLSGGRVTLDEGTGVTQLGLITDRGRATLPVLDGVAEFPDVATTHLTLTLDRVQGDPARQRAAGIRAVAIPGVSVSRTVVLPEDPWPQGPDQVVMSGDVGHGDCTFLGQRPLCAVGSARVGEDAGGLDRTFTTPTAFVGQVAMTARPLPNAGLQAAVEKALGLKVHAVASSTAMPDLAAGPVSAVDGDLGTPWVASPSDPDPSLTLSWQRVRAVNRVQILVDQYAALTRPTHVQITSPAGTRDADIDAQGWASFPDLRTNALTIHFSAHALATSVDAYTLATTFLGLGVSDVRIEGLTPTIVFDRTSLREPISLPCGTGPNLAINGQVLPTRVETTVGALLRSEPVAATVCRLGAADHRPASFAIPSGVVRVQAGTPDVWDVASIVLTRDRSATAATAPMPPPVIRDWQGTRRVVALGDRAASSVLVITENVNRGWTAKLGSTALVPTTVGGWQQGFLVPAGAAGEVHLSFAPDSPVRWGMAVGGLLAALVGVFALVPERRRFRLVRPAGRSGAIAVVLSSVVCLSLAAGWWGVAVFVVVAGLTRVAVLRGGLSRRSWPAQAGAVLALTGAGAVLVAGNYGSATYLADRPPAQLLCVAALSFVTISLWQPGRRRPRVATRPTARALEPDAPDGSPAAPGTGS